MSEQPNSFAALIRQVRAGDDAAAVKLLQKYEPAIRRVIRVRMTDPKLRRLVDSADICQSVFANFFVRAASGQFDLDSSRQLLNLLATMAQNKLRDLVRREQAGRRDHRLRQGDAELAALADDAASPSRIVAARELLQQLRAGLSDEERALADQRAHGLGWPEIAAKLGGNADALRMKLSRAIDRVAGQLGLHEVPYE